MKKFVFTIAAICIALCCALVCGCKKSEAPFVGTYYMLSVTASNGVKTDTYGINDGNPVVSKNSLVLEIKDNYRWNMSIMLPGIIETEDGIWEDNDGKYYLKEDNDDYPIPVSYSDGTIKFTFAEDDFVISATLVKNLA